MRELSIGVAGDELDDEVVEGDEIGVDSAVEADELELDGAVDEVVETDELEVDGAVDAGLVFEGVEVGGVAYFASIALNFFSRSCRISAKTKRFSLLFDSWFVVKVSTNRSASLIFDSISF
jgi:hypothetical protein